MTLLIFTCLILLAVLEVVLRLVAYETAPSAPLEYRYYLKPELQAGFDIQENFPKTTARVEDHYYYDFWSNELGCFDKPYNGEKDYVLLVGDSFTHMFASYEDKCGTIVENLLDVRVLKCGVVGYGTKQEYIKAQKIISKVKHPPELIIIGYFINDLTDDYVFPGITVSGGLMISTYQVSDLARGISQQKRQTIYRK